MLHAVSSSQREISMTPHSLISITPADIIALLSWRLPSSMTAARIVGFYLINFFSVAWVQCIAMGTSNVAGYTKKATMAAGTFMGYSLGNIIGPLTFDA